mmetsp:Transcript_50159/g.162394  ORF Transcript_50159/g.162394 Transcript_50159/m.162394 type:complete len:227 (+) Transcript_50159:263-943(+)
MQRPQFTAQVRAQKRPSQAPTTSSVGTTEPEWAQLAALPRTSRSAREVASATTRRVHHHSGPWNSGWALGRAAARWSERRATSRSRSVTQRRSHARLAASMEISSAHHQACPERQGKRRMHVRSIRPITITTECPAKSTRTGRRERQARQSTVAVSDRITCTGPSRGFKRRRRCRQTSRPISRRARGGAQTKKAKKRPTSLRHAVTGYHSSKWTPGESAARATGTK